MIRRRSLMMIRVVLWLFPFGVLLWIVDQHLVVSGKTTLRCSVEQCDPRIKNFASKEPEILVGTSKDTTDQYRVITADPLYFDAALFRSLKRATVRLTYQNPDEEQRLRIGVVTPGSKYDFFDFADHIKIIFKLEHTWDPVRSGDLTLFVRPDAGVKAFSSVGEFLDNLPDLNRIATYNLDLRYLARIPSYVPSTSTLKIGTGIRGSRTLLVYVGKGEGLDLKFTVRDLNRHAGKDDVTIDILHGNKLLSTEALRDDGNVGANGAVSAARTIHLLHPELNEGTYRIEVVAKSGDALITSIESKHQLLVFEKTLSLAASSEYSAAGQTNDTPITVYVQGTKLSASAMHEKSVQTITVGSRQIRLGKVNKPVQVTLPTSRDLIPVTVPIQDVLLQTDGVIALSPEQFFNLKQFSVDALMEKSDLNRYDYVLAQYVRPEQAGKWLVATKTFSAIPKGRVTHFVIIGDPALGEGHRTLRVRELEIRMEGDALTPAKILELGRKAIRKLRSGSL